MIPVSSALTRPSVTSRVNAMTNLQRQPTIPNRWRTDFWTGPSYVRKYSSFQPFELEVPAVRAPLRTQRRGSQAEGMHSRSWTLLRGTLVNVRVKPAMDEQGSQSDEEPFQRDDVRQHGDEDPFGLQRVPKYAHEAERVARVLEHVDAEDNVVLLGFELDVL